MSSKCNREKVTRRKPVKAFAGSGIDKSDNAIEVVLGNGSKIAALREEKAKKIIDIFINASLPRLVRLSEKDGSAELRFNIAEIGKFGAVI